MSSISDAIRILERIEDDAPDIDQDELESRLSELEQDAVALGEHLDQLRQVEVHNLDDHIANVVSEAESLATSISQLYSDV